MPEHSEPELVGCECEEDKNLFRAFYRQLYATIDTPVTWFRKNVVEKNQQKYPWYHRQFRRVPTIDQCYDDDPVCDFEANSQFKRDRMVDNEILSILRTRYEDCMLYERPDHVEKCTHLWRKYQQAEEAWFIKSKTFFIKRDGTVWDGDALSKCRDVWAYSVDCARTPEWLRKVDGDLGGYADARKAYMKQKHRMVWERRNGPLSDLTK